MSTSSGYAYPSSVLRQFRETAWRDPRAVCLRYFGRDVDREGTDRLSDSFASLLLTSGVRRGDRLVLALQNTPGFVITMLGACKAGVIVIPVNPMVRGPELAYVLRDADARSLVASSAMADVIEQAAGDSIGDIDVFWSEPHDFAGGGEIPFLPDPVDESPAFGLRIAESLLASLPPTSFGSAQAAESQETAVICYTSGTTGSLKGAMISHGNLSYQADTARERFCVQDGDPVLALAPLFHITGLAQHLALCLANGLPLVLTHRFHPETVLSLIEETPPALTVAAITAFIALASASDADDDSPLKHLKNVVSGGAAVPAAVVQDLEQRFGFYVRNAYGMTETASATIGVPMGSRAPVEPRTDALSIGQAHPHTTVSVVDRTGAELPRGAEGELVVSGPQVGLGYWNRPEETANTFRADGVHTGDAAIIDEDGWVYIVDRLKDMVIVSGYKVWPREVEDVLFNHPDVVEAAVVGVPDEYRGETLVAYVVSRTGCEPTPSALKDCCRSHLSAYKCPSTFHFADALPKTATGKVLRRVLAENG